jgi:glycosyltransferase involved in cell wall biosynthesis
LEIHLQLKEYLASNGDLLLYTGNPDLSRLDGLARGPGDLWHSSLDRGYLNAFHEIVYQTHIAWWYVEDFQGLDSCINWRIDPSGFVVRKNVWEHFEGFNPSYRSAIMGALSLGYDMIKNGAVPLYTKGLFNKIESPLDAIPVLDKFQFFQRKFRWPHSLYLLMRCGLLNPLWHFAFWKSLFTFKSDSVTGFNTVKMLNPIQGYPSISYIIPTMMRQSMTMQLLHDLANQSYPPSQVIIVDATPEKDRLSGLYFQREWPFKLEVVWQTSKGSCRARNEGIEHSNGDYIIFGDDDIRLPEDFIENHVRFMQTYQVDACNGLDIRADHPEQDLNDLSKKRMDYFLLNALLPGISNNFNNANSCISRKVLQLVPGNDVNYDGGYGEDSDFGLSLVKKGYLLLHNPYSVNLHLKPPVGGYRFWGAQSKVTGKKRKRQPWEINRTVGWIRPVPSPTIMYYAIKHFGNKTVKEYKIKNIFDYLTSCKWWITPVRLFLLPKRLMQLNQTVKFAKDLNSIGFRIK